MSDRSDYRHLQKHLHRQPVGFPATPTGADIRLLRHLFTPEEARVARGLSHHFRTVDEIAGYLGEKAPPGTELERLLDLMASKGSVACRRRGGTVTYATLPLVVGMYEARVKDLSENFLKDFSSYTSSPFFGLEFISAELPQMRTIPIEESLTPEFCRASYDDIRSIIEATAEPIVVNECICRKAAELRGEPCKLTDRTETCLALGDMADMCLTMEIGRMIGREEALDILCRNEAEGLVVQPSNSRKVEFICSCCGCCCGMLHVHQALPRPLDFWAAGYRALVDRDQCTGCGLCAHACQVGAIDAGTRGGVVTVNELRCIGCGQCVAACPSEALRIGRRDDCLSPPATMDDLFDILLARKKGWREKLSLALRIIFRLPRKQTNPSQREKEEIS